MSRDHNRITVVVSLFLNLVCYEKFERTETSQFPNGCVFNKLDYLEKA